MEKHIFYQSKYEYYRKFNLWVVIAAAVSSALCFGSDCFLLRKITYVTLFPRLFIIIPVFFYFIVHKKTKDYRIMVPMAYLVAHGVMWCTIWACIYLPDLSFACAGFISVNFIFLALAISAPIEIGIIAHGLLFLDISIANTFLHYPDFFMMLLIGVPCYIGICIFEIAIEKTYKDQYNMKIELEKNILHDALTGAYNRNILKKIVNEQNELKVFSKEHSGVILFDFDYFKKINDTYGHEVGDEVLEKTADKVHHLINENDFFIRWGGEEFVVITSGDKEELKCKAIRIRQEIEDIKYSFGNITVSIGISQYKGGDYHKLMKEADIALYEAKENGRNQIVFFDKEKQA